MICCSMPFCTVYAGRDALARKAGSMGYIELKTEEADGPPPQVALESILDSMGTGRFRYILLVLCGLAFMADAMV